MKIVFLTLAGIYGGIALVLCGLGALEQAMIFLGQFWDAEYTKDAVVLGVLLLLFSIRSVALRYR